MKKGKKGVRLGKGGSGRKTSIGIEE